MTIARGFLIVVLSGLGFAIGGGLIGYTLALVAPAYYRGVFSSGREPWFDPVQVGLGLGITQGAVCGVIVGSVVVLAVAWYNSRPSAPQVHLPPHESRELTPPAGWPSDERITGERGTTPGESHE